MEKDESVRVMSEMLDVMLKLGAIATTTIYVKKMADAEKKSEEDLRKEVNELLDKDFDKTSDWAKNVIEELRAE